MDPHTGILPAPNGEVLAFVRNYFSQNNNLNLSSQLFYDYRSLSYHYYIHHLEAGVRLYIITDIFGAWITVQLQQVTPNYVLNASLPEPFIDTLPVKIGNYLSANYSGKNIISVTYFDETYTLEINRSLFLEFDKDGNFLKQQEKWNASYIKT